MKTIALAAGEVSGDFLAAGLIDELKNRLPDSRFIGIAGPRMIEAGCVALYPSEKLAVMGFTEAFGRLPEIYAIRRKFRNYLLRYPPDIFIGIDAPDFNLGLEEKLRAAGIPTVHYVSPSVWAWRAERIHKIRRSVDRMLTLFPFEADFYREHHVPVSFVGHPLADNIPLEVDQLSARQRLGLTNSNTIIGVLPGSRKTEVEKIGPIFCQAIKLCYEKNPGFRFVAPMATPAIHKMFRSMVDAIIPGYPLQLYDGRSQDVMIAADILMVASGTATLEALLCKRPMVVAYKMAASTWWYMKRKFIVDRYALPNHLAGHDVALELYQEKAQPGLIANEVMRLHNNPAEVEAIKQEFAEIHRRLQCNASVKAADAVIDVLQR